ncbi:glycosyltransferase family 39 protein [Streptomyces sp. NPDC026665]|uniref:glycosyltransferase family 39 protein n=1 Tax=Streptomyces sp. NPDC026665 TaxID=3154798 RepID=UPI0033EFCD2E
MVFAWMRPPAARRPAARCPAARRGEAPREEARRQRVRRRDAAAAVASVLAPVLVMLAIGLWGLDRGGMWRDEAVTFQVAQRSVPQIWQLLHSVDAVHGLYYLLMHAVLAPHPGEVALRLPSVCGAAATAGLVAALGVRLCRPRVGLWAGLLYAVTPMTGHFAQEGRSYALVAAGAAGATLLLVGAARSARPGPWLAYGATVAVTCLLHEMALLLLLAHALTLALARVPARVWRAWFLAAAATALVLAPLVWVSHAQSAQVAWLPRTGLVSVRRLLGLFTGPARLVIVPYLVLGALAFRPERTARGTLSITAVALPLAAVPPAVLLTVSHWRPLYDERYVLYALAGAPLLAAAGADHLATRLPRLLPHAVTTGVLAVTLVLAVQLPLLRADRSPDRRPDDLAAVSAVAHRELRPGDPVLFLPSLARRAALAYPKGFRGIHDIALSVPAPASGTLYGREADPAELRRRLDRLDRVWLVAAPFAARRAWRPAEETERLKLAVVREQFEPVERIVRRGVTLRLYVRRSTYIPEPRTGPPRPVPPSAGPAGPGALGSPPGPPR